MFHLRSLRDTASAFPLPWRAPASRAAVVAFGVAIVFAGCSSLAVDGHDLEGTRWVAISVAGHAPIAGSEPTIVFENGLVHGSSGCNTYSSQDLARIESGKLVIGATLTTLGRCIETGGGDAPVMPIEEAFSAALRTANHVQLRGEQLVISGSGGELVFEQWP